MRTASFLSRASVPVIAMLGLVTGCAPFRPGLPSDPVAREAAAATGQGALIAREARAQVGVPYRWGGSEPAGGFDCSGLVAYLHAEAGLLVPRTVVAQFAASRRVGPDELLPGDLVFFRLKSRGGAVSHVGIYTGQRRFVHAPQSGRDVVEASLDDPYFRDHYVGAGRFHDVRDDGRGPALKSAQ